MTEELKQPLLSPVTPQKLSFALSESQISPENAMLSILQDLSKTDTRLLGHTKKIFSVQVSRDNQYLVSGAKDNTVKLWSLEKQHEICTFRGHTDTVTSVLTTNSTYLQPNQIEVYSASKDSTIKHWRTHLPEDITTFIGHNAGVNSLDLHPSQRKLLSCSDDHSVIIWDTSKVSVLHKLESHTAPVNSVKFFQDGRQAVSGSDDLTLKVWNTETGELLYTSDVHKGKVLTLDQAGKFIASGCSAGIIYIWQENVKIHSFEEGFEKAVRSLKFNSSQNFLISAGDDHFIHIWNLERNARETSIFAHEQQINSIDISPDQQFIVSASNDNSIGVWRLKRGLEDFTIDKHLGAVTSISASVNKERFVTGSDDCSVKLCDLQKKTLIRELVVMNDSVTCTSLSKSGNICVSGAKNGDLAIWNLATETFVKKEFNLVPRSLAVNVSDKFFVVGFKANKDSKQSCVKIYSLENLECFKEYPLHSSANSLAISDKQDLIIVGTSEGKVLKFCSNEIENVQIAAHQMRISAVKLEDDENLLCTAAFDHTIKLWKLSDLSPLATLKGHTDKVLALDIGINGRYLVSGSADKTTRIWNIREKREEFSLTLHSAEVLATAFSCKNRFIISGSRDCTVKLWETQENTKAKKFHLHSKTITCVGSTPDGRLGISGSEDLKLRIWDLHSGRETVTFRLPSSKNSAEGCPLCLVVNQAGKLLVVGSSDKKIYLYSMDSASTKPIVLKGHVGEVNCLVLSSNNANLFSGSSDHTIRKWCLNSHRELQIFHASTKSIQSLSLSSNNVQLLSGSSDGKVKCYNLTKSHEIASVEVSSTPIIAAFFTRDDLFSVIGSRDGTIHLWDLSSYQVIYSIRLHKEHLKCLALSSCGRYVYSGSSDRSIKIWNIKEQYEEFTIEAHSKPVTCIHVNSVNSLIISGSEDENVNLWISKGSFFEKFLQGHALEVHAVAASQSYVATGSADKSIKLWNCRNLLEEAELVGHTDRVFALEFTSDGRKLVSGSRDCKVIVWDVGQKVSIKILEGHSDAVNCVICVDDVFVVSGSNDKTVRIWNISTEEPVAVLAEHKAAVLTLAYSGVRKWIASGSSDKSIMIWDFVEKKLERTLIAHSLAVQALCFTSDGKYLISGSNDTKLIIWNLLEKKVEKTLTFFAHPILSLLLTRDNNYLVVALADSTIQLLPFNDASHQFMLKKLDTCIKSICLSDNEDKIFAALDKPQLFVTDFNKRLRAAGLSSHVYENFIENETKNLIPTNLSNFQNFLRFYNIFYCLKCKDYSKLSPSSSGVQVSKYNFTYTHFLCFFGQGKVLRKLIGTEFALRADGFGHSAFFYAIFKQDQECVDVLLEFMIGLGEAGSKSSLATSFNAIQEDFQLIIKNSSQYLPQFLNILLQDHTSDTVYAEALSSLPLTKFSQNHSITKKSFPLHFQEHHKLSSNFKQVKEKHLKFLTTALRIPDKNGTASSLSLLDSISKCSNGEIFKTSFIKYYISHKFNSLKCLAYVLASVLFFNIFITVILIIYSSSNYYVLGPFIAVNIFLFLWEMIQMGGAKLNYFTDVLNYVDVARIGVSVTWVVLDWFTLRYFILTWFMLVINLFRGFSALRVFDGARHYISLLKRALKNIFWFLFVFVYCTASFGLILIVSKESENEKNVFSFANIWMMPYNMAIGFYSVEEPGEVNFTYIGFLVITVVNVMILMNLLIAILGDTYDEFLTQKEVIDGREKVELILEIEQVYYTFVPGKNSTSFLQVCDKVTRNVEGKWKGRILHLEQEIRKLGKLTGKEKKVKEVVPADEKLNNKVEQIEEKLNSLAKIFDNQMERLYRLQKRSAGDTGQTDSIDRFVSIARESISEAFSGQLSEAFSGRLVEDPDKLHSRIDNFEENLTDSFSKQSMSVQSVKQDLSKLLETMKKKLEEVKKESENMSKNFVDQLIKDRKKIDDSIRVKIEEKISSLEANIQNKINNSVGAIDKNVYSRVEAAEDNLKGYIERVATEMKETISSRFERLGNNLE